MGRKSHETFEKKRIEKLRQEKRAAKRDRRQSASSPEAEAVDQDALMERFRELSEQRASGAVDETAYEAARHEIFVLLGLEQADD